MTEMESEHQDDSELDDATTFSGMESVEEEASNEESDRDEYTSPPEPTGPIHSGPPHGMLRADVYGRALIDSLAGRASVFGFGFEPITKAIQAGAERYLGDAAAFDSSESEEGPLRDSLLNLLDDSPNIDVDSILLSPSADEAVDLAIGLARVHGKHSAFRTIAFVGSDHGRTGMGRTASGKPELSSGFGPMMAGFSHVPINDLDAVRNSIDDQTVQSCCHPLISPTQLVQSMPSF